MVSEVTGNEILELLELAIQSPDDLSGVFDIGNWVDGQEVLKEVQGA